MRKIIAIFLVLVLLFPAAAFAASPPRNFNEAVSYSNKDIQLRYKYPGSFYKNKSEKGRSLRWDNNYRVGNNQTQLLVYGTPWGDYKNGIQRYLGYTLEDVGVTNINYPFDDPDFTIVDNLNWIKAPWDSKTVQKVVREKEGGVLQNNYFNGKLIFRQPAYIGLSTERNNGKPIVGSKAKNIPWEQYMHVCMPPTQYTWGIGRMWYWKNGYPYYKTVMLPPYSFYQKPADPPKGKDSEFKGELGGGGGFR